MIELTTFGATELRRDGTDVRSVLSQPKRLALLVHLRVAAAGGFVPRERLLALFWPESDDERARNALRQSLHFLRRSLGDDAIVSRTDRDIGVDPSIACDAVRFQEALDAGRLDEAVELYRGEFLPGFFVEDAPEAERWIEEQRAEFARRAAAAAWSLCEMEEARGEPGAAAIRARRALAIDPLDETGVRRTMRLLADSGARPAALEVFQEFERRLDRELDLTPDEETLRLAAAIRADPARPAPSPVASEMRASTPEPTPPPPSDAIAAPPPTGEPVRDRRGGDRRRATRLEPVPAAPAPVAPSRTSNRHRVWIAAGLVLVAVAAAWSLSRRTPPPAPEVPPSVAVLPFVDMSGGDNVYFSDGVTEELLNVLAGVPNLRVAARTSSFAFRDRDIPVDSIGRALNVTHVVEGSVRSSGNRVRITAQLIETRSGFHIWSQTYDRELDDIFQVQDEISAEIAQKLQISLAGNFWGLSDRETTNPEAYRLVLRALHTFRTPSPSNYATSASLLEQAIRSDPEYARAYGALANVLLWQASFGWVPPEPARERADSLARRGLALGETPEAHLALARLAEVRAWNPDSADTHFLRALELNPSDTRALQYRALFLARSGRGEEAIVSARRATELDPLHPGAWVNLASVLSMQSREDESLAMMEKARDVAPRDLIVLTNLANQYANVGRIDDALATSERALAVDSTDLNLQGLRVHLLFQAGHTQEAERGLVALERNPAFPRFRLATLWIHTGDEEHVLDLLEESAARREDELTRIRSPDLFPTLRSDPRFLRLLERLEAGET